MDGKSWYLSKGIWGAIISIAAKAVGAIFGVEIASEDTVQVTDLIIAAISFGVSFIGDFVAIYGRVKATKAIK